MGALRNHPAGKSLTVAVAGQPNTGKSTLFNRLTGLNQRVGNWTGKTVDRKEGAALWNGVAFTFVDLPGCYGMTPHSPEEEVARDFPADPTPCSPWSTRRAWNGACISCPSWWRSACLWSLRST